MEPSRPRTIQLPLTASPCGRLSRPPSNISQYDFHPVVRPFSPWRFVGPYNLRTGWISLVHVASLGCMLADTNPVQHRSASSHDSVFRIPPSPLRDWVSYSDHDRFRGYFPVHFIPAYNLPVYASQRPLPSIVQRNSPHWRPATLQAATPWRSRSTSPATPRDVLATTPTGYGPASAKEPCVAQVASTIRVPSQRIEFS